MCALCYLPLKVKVYLCVAYDIAGSSATAGTVLPTGEGEGEDGCTARGGAEKSKRKRFAKGGYQRN